MKKIHTIAGLASFITGIGLFYIEISSFLSQKELVLASILFGLILVLLTRKTGQWILIIPTFIALGFLRAHIDESFRPANTIDRYNDQAKSITLIGTVCDEPDRRPDKLKLTVCTESVMKTTEEKIEGRVLINTALYPEYKFGDILKVRGKLETPGEFNGFSYKNYLYRYGINSVMYLPRIDYVGKSFRSRFAFLYEIKRIFESKLNEVFPEPFGSFMAGIITGSRKGIPEKLTEQFATTGLSHIVAISGYNITILVTVIMAVLRPLGKKRAIALSAITIILFTISVGASAAVVRACIMGLISLLALHYGRKSDVTITLLLAASAMLLINPRILVYDAGFQLSFLATAGLIYVSPLLDGWTKRIPDMFGMKESFTLTMSAQISTLPALLIHFDQLSLVAPLANLLIAGPFIPFAMLSGFLSAITSLISVPLAKLVGFPGYISLSYIIQVVETTSQIPYAALKILWFHAFGVIVYYALLGTILILKFRKESKRQQIEKTPCIQTLKKSSETYAGENS